MSTDPFQQFKATQREGWATFAPLETFTTPPAGKLVAFAGVSAGQNVLDVACGTGVVAVTAARKGARVRALDLAPALLEHAKKNASWASVEIEFTEGDVEALPYPDAGFDVVLSQFGHMFAPRPEVAISEMLRVLKPGGMIAFSTWPPELMIGKMFMLVGKYMGPPPGPAPAPSPQWGDPNIVRERLGDRVTDLHFDRDVMNFPTLSPRHYREGMEATAAPVQKLISMLANDAAKLASFRSELESLVEQYLSDNVTRQHFLMSRAIKR